eukprot:5568190-Pleurochrysis_carterae.AAC.1
MKGKQRAETERITKRRNGKDRPEEGETGKGKGSEDTELMTDLGILAFEVVGDADGLADFLVLKHTLGDDSERRLPQSTHKCKKEKIVRFVQVD